MKLNKRELSLIQEALEMCREDLTDKSAKMQIRKLEARIDNEMLLKKSGFRCAKCDEVAPVIKAVNGLFSVMDNGGTPYCSIYSQIEKLRKVLERLNDEPKMKK